jgi:invasion protein IalB
MEHKMSREYVRFLLALSFGVAGASLAGAATAPRAEQAAAPAAAAGPTDVKTYGDWVVRCFPVKAPAQCDMFQATVERATQRRIVSVSIAYVPGSNLYVAKFVVPLGAMLQDGLTVMSDKIAGTPLAFSRCENDGCYTEGPLDSKIVERLARAKTAGIVMAMYSGGKATLPLSLRGFPEALAAMKALSIQKDQASSPRKAVP